MTVAGAILAAGEGSRFAAGELAGEHKLRASFRGRPVVCWAVGAAASAGFDQLYVVTGAVPLDDLLGAEATVIHNPHWAGGQATSLRVAVEAADADGHEALVVGLGDQPLVPAEAWRAVGAAAGPIVTATFDGRRRPPVKLHRSVWPELPRQGDHGARTLMRERSDLVSEVPCWGNPVDIDTVEDLRRWS
jgi:CTP:molybdopterin cytidylyltransferase MocA